MLDVDTINRLPGKSRLPRKGGLPVKVDCRGDARKPPCWASHCPSGLHYVALLYYLVAPSGDENLVPLACWAVVWVCVGGAMRFCVGSLENKKAEWGESSLSSGCKSTIYAVKGAR